MIRPENELNIKSGITKVKKHVRQRSFLLRIILSIFTAVLIPFLMLNTVSATKENEQLTHSMQTEIASAALIISEQTEACMSAVASMASSINEMALDTLKNDPLVSDEIALIRQLKYQKLSLPFLQDIGYYDQNTDQIYLSSGKYPIKYFSELVLKESQEDCISILNRNRRGFVTLGNENQLTTLYLVPLRLYSGVHRYCLAVFVMNNSSMSNFFRSFLPSHYHLNTITAPDGTVIYCNSYDTDSSDASLITGTAVSPAGYTTSLSALKQTMTAASVQYSSVVRTLIILTVLLCFVLLLVLIFLNYMPIYKVVKKILKNHEPDSEAGELSVIDNAFKKQADENRALNERVLMQRTLLIDYTYEHLLDGKTVTAQEMENIRRYMPAFCIICAKNSDTHATDHIIRHNNPDAAIYAYEHYLSGYVVLICRIDNDNPKDKITEKAVSMLGNVDLGESDTGTEPQQIRVLFLQASGRLEQKLKSKEHFADVQENELAEKTHKLHSAIIQFIDDHFLDMDISITSVSESIGLGEYTTGRLLKNIYGDNFRHIINMKRLEYAKELLLTSDRAINDISTECGFSSPSYFIKVFKDFEGITPALYRDSSTM